MQFDESHHSDLYPVFLHVERETPTYEFPEYRNLYEHFKWLSPPSLDLFKCIFLWIFLKHNPVYTYQKHSCQLTEACHVFYNVKLDDKCGN